MALINCPECSKEISDKATACPSCGCPVLSLDNSTLVNIKVKKFKLGKKKRNTLLSIILLVSGTILLYYSLFRISVEYAIILLFVSIILILTGIYNFTWQRPSKCPYCEKPIKVPLRAGNYKCRLCKKISVVKGDYLETVPD